MNNEFGLRDLTEFSRQQRSVRSSVSSTSTGFPSWDTSSTPATSPPSSERRLSVKSASDVTVSIPLTGPLTLDFVKGSKLFKLRYSQIDVCRDATGTLRCIELLDPGALSGTFIHVFINDKRPIPHLEQPATKSQSSLRVCFFGEQSVQVAQTIFNTQPQYNFDNSHDCIRFQQEVLRLRVEFVAGVAEISSKGRGEEAISQNLRVCKANNGTVSILFFANCLRKEQKRYVTLSLDSVDKAEHPKKSNKPVHLRMNSTGELAAQMKDLSILFLDGDDIAGFLSLLQANGVKTSTK